MSARSHAPTLLGPALAVLLGSAATTSAHAFTGAGPVFRAPLYEFGPGGFTRSLQLADLNGDGLADLVAAGTPYGVAVALARGGGSFGPFTGAFGSSRYFTAVVGDFDGDGRLDVAGTSSANEGIPAEADSGAIFVACGDGQGGWSSFYEAPTASAGEFVAAGDVDRDGRTDLVVSFNLVDSVAVFRGRSDRTLEPAWEDAVLSPTVQMGVGEFTGDASPDLVVAEGDSGQVGIFPGHGDGTFGPRVDSPSVARGNFLAVPTLDPLAPPVVLVTGYGVGGIVLPSAGGGALGPGSPIAQSTFEGIGGLALGDVNGDGKIDCVTVNRPSSSTIALTAHLGDGLGGFGTPVRSNLVSSFAADETGTLGDMDGDGRLDYACTVGFSSHGALARGNGDGTFGGPAEPDLVSGSFRSVAVGDLDEDGRPDAVTADYGGSQLWLAHGDGDGTFAALAPLSGSLSQASELATGDFDGDGHLDLVSVSANGLGFHKGHGDGTLDAPVLSALGSGPQAPTLVDLDGDGKLDVVVPCSGGSELDVFLQGPGGLGSRAVQAVAAGPFAVRYADLNHDGALDRVLACTAGLVVELGDGSGGFLPAVTHPLADTPGDFALADLDEDGVLDAVITPGTTSSAVHSIVILRGHVDGTFDSDATLDLNWNGGPGNYAEPATARRVLAQDFDGDGHADLALLDYSGKAGVLAFRGRGDRTFGAPEVMSLGSSTSGTRFAAADLNGDGRPDIVCTPSRSNGATVISTVGALLNQSGGIVAVDPAPGAGPAARGGLALSGMTPNPSPGRFAVTLTAARAGTARLALYAPNGREVWAQAPRTITAGANRLTVDPGAARLPAGVYWLRASSGEAHAATRVVLLDR